MSIDPKIVATLMRDVPEMRDFRRHIISEALKLHSLEGIEEVPMKERAEFVTASLRALEVLKKILAPMELSTPGVANTASEYVL